MLCRICDNDGGKSVCCPSCHCECCQPCFQTYLMTNNSGIDCMYCHKRLRYDFLYDNTEPKWVSKVYKERLRVVLFDREFAQMPAEQERVAMYIKAHSQLATYSGTDTSHKIKQQKYYYNTILSNYGINPREAAKPKKAAAYIKACIMDGCKGFLNKSMTCGLCAVKVCANCYEQKSVDGHTCNADAVASVKAIKAEARPCPSCSSLISKIDGCDQMWCTQCHVTFSWLTGLKESGATHNPHYYAWARLNRGLAPVREERHAAACAFPTLAELVAICNDPVILEYHRQLVHIKATVLTGQLPQHEDNTDLRVLYMAGEYSKYTFTESLLDRFIKLQMRRRRRQVYEMVYTVGGDLLRNCTSVCALELKQLLAYGDECLRKISDQYGADCGSLTL